jgi:hypothetical protein
MIKLLMILLQLIQVGRMNTSEPKPDDPNTPEEQQTPAPPEKGAPGFMDEVLIVLLLIPVIGVFIPQARDSVREGLLILNEMPEWFSFLVVLGVVSVFGFRKQLTEILSNLTNFRKK